MNLHSFERTKDNTLLKNQRRVILDELCSQHTILLATDYPGEYGQKFLKGLHRNRPKLDITLVNKKKFPREQRDKKDGIERIPKDIFDIMSTHPATLIDLDLCGGFSKRAQIAIERAPNWKQILFTFSGAVREKNPIRAIPANIDEAAFMDTWCKERGWQLPNLVQRPYAHPNKNGKYTGPKYQTYVITR